ncbi:hypothetical protein CK203_068640 [Vitis vinifera]|uniref:Wall-associated receptor kinase galacturonan-binding domain-containing protein n=1 Tax=Vitis vinifera TaxID=29760 RepID=A0A438EE24_VITVI|nr:hypothetical protein CK203_068640 [Vitis vinifera]
MASLFTCRYISESLSSSFAYHLFFLILTPLIFPFLTLTAAQASLCRTSCGGIPINYPFGIDDGCGSPYYRHILVCPDSGQLELRTPSGRYPVRSLSYSDPHILVSDPFMWNCQDGDAFRPTRPFSLDTSTHFSLSPQNDYLFFNCSEDDVIVEPKPIFCERFPDRCDSSCDSASYLCRHLPECASALGGSSCCSYYPKATESLRLMLKYCASYTSVYWRSSGGNPPDDQIPEYGFGISCAFVSKEILPPIVKHAMVSLLLNINKNLVVRHNKRIGVIAGTATAVSFAGVVGIAAGIWYLIKLRKKAPVACGVQSNENRLF